VEYVFSDVLIKTTLVSEMVMSLNWMCMCVHRIVFPLIYAECVANGGGQGRVQISAN
jgi:hypothetical protein